MESLCGNKWWKQADFMEMHQTQPKKSVRFHLQWQPFFRVCFLMMWWRFTADRISHQLPLPCPEPLSPEWLLRFSLWRSLAIPATARPGVYSFTPLTIPMRGDCGAGEDEVNCSVRGKSWPGNWAPLAQPSSRSQTTGYCLLLKPVDVSTYLKSDFVSDLSHSS